MSAPTTQALLVELCTEELPPKALEQLGIAFAQGLQKILEEQALLAPGCAVQIYATPRRLAAHFSQVLNQAEDQPYTEKLMPVHIGLDADGAITPALAKRLQAKGLGHIQAGELVTESDGKQDYLYARGLAKGASLSDALQQALDYALTHLPIPKVMRYQLSDGVTSVRFVRPAHALVALWGDDIVPVQALGLQAGRTSFGHRFMGRAHLEITHPDTYAQQLLEEGKVIASFTERRALILEQLQAKAAALQVTIGDDAEVHALLNEVTALVEHPTVYVGEFEQQFLAVPAECLILTMRLNQKYFPLFDPNSGKLSHQFLIVSNMQPADPSHIIEGNQRVVRPRLADAQFFFETDRKTPLVQRVDSLSSSVYHNKLGSQLDRIGRLRSIAQYIAKALGASVELADRAALLAKADLNSSMVGEFPELQGIIGAYYAQADQEPEEVVLALREQYRHRLDKPVTAFSLTQAILFLAERAEVLIGIWGIGLAPTGERDPYALRRAALGLISAFEQLGHGQFLSHSGPQTLRLNELLAFSASTFTPGVLQEQTQEEVCHFIYERYRNQLINDYDRHVVEAVLSLHPHLVEVQARIQACAAFAQRPEADSLAAANKRISNLLKKNTEQITSLQESLLQEPAEQELARTIAALQPVAQAQYAAGQFAASLETLAQAKDAVDNFFKDVMVMADDPAIRHNRLALLASLHQLMNQVADISRLAQ
ncbi:glycine--tRNA ligase subunit beta [Alcaligenes endophyticus]|uniref:Glycine--tRNA ligase beta subunit n=1 Tax=Alcaligenes endophyticus TaxID=1929088 RepID=A0ABT8EMP6_9BURK|nr:glycine--tRNA ligase subunit beta [Alcaligenes endophyticus]MCX5591546.1 glycine--tRNA ligase subunit beta [Alcaligenes endophyticus]MDN4122573.1 glycine--tRNA ligase subunit beta [Alcaligenes endophyticus]